MRELVNRGALIVCVLDSVKFWKAPIWNARRCSIDKRRALISMQIATLVQHQTLLFNYYHCRVQIRLGAIREWKSKRSIHLHELNQKLAGVTKIEARTRPSARERNYIEGSLSFCNFWLRRPALTCITHQCVEYSNDIIKHAAGQTYTCLSNELAGALDHRAKN